MPGTLALPGTLPESLRLHGGRCPPSQPPPGTALCGVCQQNQFRYTCPRCEVVYCSLPCYQRHGDKCTENFYQRQVQEELSSQRASGEEKKRLEQIVSQLNRLDADDLDDSDGGDDYPSAEEVADRRLEELVAKAD